MAPNNDLNLLKSLKEYESIDEEVAKAVQKGFLNHLQYLDNTHIGLCLFDENVSLPIKKNIIEALHAPENQKNTSAKSIVESNNVLTIDLHTFVQDGSGIRKLFKALQIPESLLNVDPEQWHSLKDFQNAKSRIQWLEVVNDNAERGIALIKTYNSKLSTDENLKQCILQLVEEHRKNYKSPKKADLV